ncbi:MAG: phosphonate transport system permease protein [Verrucomicrobiales bacterium]|jgi:phosphonate transport system permease protein
MSRSDHVSQLRHARPRDRFLRVSLCSFVILLVSSWLTGEFRITEFDWERRLSNCQRFLHNALPFPLQEQPNATFIEKFSMTWRWAADLWQTQGAEAVRYTLGVSMVAIVLAGMASLVSLPFASRRLNTAAPLLPPHRKVPPSLHFLWNLWRHLARFILVVSRSVPEYMIAFFLVVSLGYNAWPAVLALAIHNTGILSRLGSELVDNIPSDTPATQRGLGATRWQIFLFTAVPSLFSRFLIFFFYRWETCVRDATILGMLGIPTLGYYILEARAKDHLDEMLYFVLLGSSLVLVGDLLSALVRWRLARAG